MTVTDQAATLPASAGRREWLGLMALLLGAAMDLIDTGIVNVAIPSIQADRGLGGASGATAEWLVAGYTLSYGVLLITGGWLGDRFGYRSTFLAGTAMFVVTSLACGLAPTSDALVVARFVQGAAAAMMTPQVLSVIQTHLPREDRGKAFGLFSLVLAIGLVAGPQVSGVLVSSDAFGLGWRSVFLINLPIGLLSLIMAALFVPRSERRRSLDLDLAGVAVLSVALMMLFYPLVEGRELGWPWWAVALLVASLPVFAVFAWTQVRCERAGRTPLIRPGLFRMRSFTGGMLAQAVFFAGVPGVFLALTLTLQTGLGFSPLHAGLTGLPWTIGIALTARQAPKLVAKFGRLVPLLGAIAIGASMAGLLLVVKMAGSGITSWHFAPALLVGGLGMGLVAPTLVNVALSDVPQNEAGSASGAVTTSGQIGSGAGVAVIGLIFFGALPRDADFAADGGTAFVDAFSRALLAGMAIFALSAVLMFLLPKRPPTPNGS
ncbi:MFS transporter [Actinomadura chokoriensis]|uniref:MFS transporter n=1 Tax=Actinomadura chokoriensis TaxID=454156 RepID=A0ABV4R6W3_9ACTN